MMRRFSDLSLPRLALAAAFAVTACGEHPLIRDDIPGQQIEVTPVQRQVASGALMQFTLINHQGFDVGYNLCGSPLERLVGNEWVSVAPPSGVACFAVLFTLHAGETKVEGHTLDALLPAGEYRLKANFGPITTDGPSIVARSGAFTVIR